MDEPISMKLFTAVVHVYDLWVCMKEDNQGLKCIKGDNSRVIVFVRDGIALFELTHSSS